MIVRDHALIIGFDAGADREKRKLRGVVTFVPNNEDDARVLVRPVDNPRQRLAEPIVPRRDVVRFRCRTLVIVVHVVADIRSDENVVCESVGSQISREIGRWFVVVDAKLVVLAWRTSGYVLEEDKRIVPRSEWKNRDDWACAG